MSETELNYVKLVLQMALLNATTNHLKTWKLIEEAHNDLRKRAPQGTTDEMDRMFDKHFKQLFPQVFN